MAQVTVRKKASGNHVKDGDRLTPAERADAHQAAAANKADQRSTNKSINRAKYGR